MTWSKTVTQSHLYQIKFSFLEYNITNSCGFLMNILGVIKGEKCQILFETPSTIVSLSALLEGLVVTTDVTGLWRQAVG